MCSETAEGRRRREITDSVFCGHPGGRKSYKPGWDAVSKLMQVHILVAYVMDLNLLEGIGVLMGWPCNPFIHPSMQPLMNTHCTKGRHTKPRMVLLPRALTVLQGRQS